MAVMKNWKAKLARVVPRLHHGETSTTDVALTFWINDPAARNHNGRLIVVSMTVEELDNLIWQCQNSRERYIELRRDFG